jgi:molybdenum cofactor cytidylyltransferase
MPTPNRRIGVLLAAGRGGRMGSTKQLKPWPSAGGPMPLICAAYDAITLICDDMVVVLGHDAEAVASALGDRAFHPAQSAADEPMFESIRAGLKRARELDPQAWVVLQPGDHPEVRPITLSAIASQANAQPTQAIIPEFAGRGGHPILIPPNIVTLLIEASCPDGLGQFWREHPQHCNRLPVDDPSIHRDVDTPADLPE